MTSNGHIYCIYNKCYKYYGDNVYKLGFAKDLKKRMHGYTTSYIDPVEIIYSIAVIKHVEAEKLLFNRLQKYRIDTNREFFKCEKKVIIATMNKVADMVNNNKTYKYKKNININNVPIINDNKYNPNEHYITLYTKLCNQKYDICTKLKLLQCENTNENIKYWHKNMTKLTNIVCINNLQPIDDLSARKISYINKILQIYGFNNIYDFDTVVVKTDALINRMKDSKLIEYNNYKAILTDFDKRILKEKNSIFTVAKFTKFANCLLNDFGLKLNIITKQIKKNKKITKLYKYNLIQTI